jgi:hypothetical protein
MEENETNLNLAALNAIQAVEGRTVLALLRAVLQELGLEKIEGIPVSEWYQKRLQEELQAQLRRIKDIDPAAAAALLKGIEGASQNPPAGKTF